MVKKNLLILLISLVLLTGCQTVEQEDTADISGSTWYDLDTFSNQTTFIGVLRYANQEYLQNWWGTLTLLGMFFVLFVVFKQNYETKQALLASSSICTILAIGFRILGLTSEQVILIGIVLTAGTLVSTLYERY